MLCSGVTVRRLALVALLGLAAGACDLFGVEGDPADNVRIRLEGDAERSVRVVTSTRFLTATGFTPLGEDSVAVELLEADTSWYALPFDSLFDIREDERFLLRVTEADTTDVVVTMRAELDGEDKGSRQRNLSEGPVEFIYVFNRGAPGSGTLYF